MDASYFIGVDVGTTSTKAIAFSAEGQVKAQGSQLYGLNVPQPGWAEQDPEEILAAVVAAIGQVMQQIEPASVAALSFSAAMHSVIAIDREDKPLTPAIIWADNRSTAQVERLKQDDTGHSLYLRTGTPIHPMSPLPKLLWLRETLPDLFQKASRFISIKEYIFHRWFNRYVVDYSIASATGLLNLKQLQWDEAALNLVGLTPDRLSEVVPTTHILRGIHPAYAEAMGLHPDTPVVIGANDGCLANLGVGAIAPSQLAITIGTSSAVRSVVPQPVTDPQGRTFCYALTENHWVIGGPSNNGGIVLRWLRDEFCQAEVEQAKQRGVDAYDVMIEEAAKIPPGAEGLICLPFLSGERAPYWNANARGIFFGAGLYHHRAHFIRSVLEGVLFNVYNITRALSELVQPAEEIRATGGFARSQVWLQMMADVFGSTVVIPEVFEAGCFGAAALAMYAMGQMESLENVETLIWGSSGSHGSHRYRPAPSISDRYHRLFKLYEQLYQNQVELFGTLASLRDQKSG
ncbi:gluconokinase [Leptolyngbya ohadii]|uniref:gluconokinase n=1 Tax=Leptolyngbya ohadii TaxID=1962290 RepID=UPI000B59E5F1|nr:gluconokinase [Leptolyngbya ohadii]